VRELDVVLQEVTQPITLGLPCYQAQYNIGTNPRGTAILACDTITIADKYKLSKGRAISAKLGTLLIVNIYAPSGSAKRETF
jgi:exonuclease III